MLTHVKIQNFRSFVEAETPLRPFTLILGANGSGKSNFLNLFQVTSLNGLNIGRNWRRHLNMPTQGASAQFHFDSGDKAILKCPSGSANFLFDGKTPLWRNLPLEVYNPQPQHISSPEKPVESPKVNGDGSGTCQVLDALKTGDREDLFDKIEAAFKTYVPEVKKLSLKTLGETKQIQVGEHSLPTPLPATELSEGTRLILCLLTILHQEKPPPIILLEDIDRGLHPRLFEYVAPLIRRMAVDHDINIIATTHNPYLVDYFREDKEAVVLVEKVDGESRLIPLPQRLKELNYGDADSEDMPLGQLWFSGLIGGTPQPINPHRAPA